MTQPCRKSATSSLRSRPVPDHRRLWQWTCSMSPQQSLGAGRGAPRSEGRLAGQDGRARRSPLMPFPPVLARRLMQLPCLKKVPPGEKVKLRQVVKKPREPPDRRTRGAPSVRDRPRQTLRQPVFPVTVISSRPLFGKTRVGSEAKCI